MVGIRLARYLKDSEETELKSSYHSVLFRNFCKGGENDEHFCWDSRNMHKTVQFEGLTMVHALLDL